MKIIKDRRIYFKGVSCDEVGAALIEMPQVTYAVPRGKKVTIPGRDGSLWLSDGGYDNAQVKVTLAVPDGNNLSKVMDWLSGYGPLIIGDAPEYYYKARVITAGQCLNITPHLNGKKLQATFTCDPFRYQVDEHPIPIATAGITTYSSGSYDWWNDESSSENPFQWVAGQSSWVHMFPGDGNVWARPIIKVTPNRNTKYKFSINGWGFTVDTSTNRPFVIDCVAMRAYKINADGSHTNISRYVTIDTDEADEWPRLFTEGQMNELRWPRPVVALLIDGTHPDRDIARFDITPNWRWR